MHYTPFAHRALHDLDCTRAREALPWRTLRLCVHLQLFVCRSRSCWTHSGSQDVPELDDELNDETFGGGGLDDDFEDHEEPQPPRRHDTVGHDDDENVEEEGVNDASGWIDSLVSEEDVPAARSQPAPSPAQQQYPPWFYNVPGYTPKQLADMIWNNLPASPALMQLLRKRQAEYMLEQEQQVLQQQQQQLQQQQHQQHQHVRAQAAAQSAQPPVPTQLLHNLKLAGSAADADTELFDRHHHTNLVYWKRSFKYMTADEVDNLLSQQRSMLKHSTYSEDYHYQQTMSRLYPDAPPPRSLPPVMGIHRPICLEPLEHPMRPEGDMFVGVLGKIPFASLKSPKPMVSLPGTHDGVLNPTGSRAIRALESGGAAASRAALLSVVEDGLVLALHLADISAIIPQLPPSERAYYLSKQQQIIASLVYILNVFVVRRPEGGSLFTALLQIAKGRKLVVRCLACLPAEQKLALLLVCLSNVSAIAAHYVELERALTVECTSRSVGSAVSGLVALSQGFTQLSDFTDFVCSTLGANLLGGLLHSVRVGLEHAPNTAPSQWPAIFSGLFDSVTGVLSVLLASSGEAEWRFLLELATLASPAQRAVIASAVRAAPGLQSAHATALKHKLGF